MPNELAFLALESLCLRRAFDCTAPPLVNCVTSISWSNEVKLTECPGNCRYTNKLSFIPLFSISLHSLDCSLTLFALLPRLLLQSWYAPFVTLNYNLHHQHWLKEVLLDVPVDRFTCTLLQTFMSPYERKNRGTSSSSSSTPLRMNSILLQRLCMTCEEDYSVVNNALFKCERILAHCCLLCVIITVNAQDSSMRCCWRPWRCSNGCNSEQQKSFNCVAHCLDLNFVLLSVMKPAKVLSFR